MDKMLMTNKLQKKCQWIFFSPVEETATRLLPLGQVGYAQVFGGGSLPLVGILLVSGKEGVTYLIDCDCLSLFRVAAHRILGIFSFSVFPPTFAKREKKEEKMHREASKDRNMEHGFTLIEAYAEGGGTGSTEPRSHSEPGSEQIRDKYPRTSIKSVVRVLLKTC